jgi:xanthine dehydrogenase accessory factor
MKIVLVRGSGDVGSAVAHVLFEAGYYVFIYDSPQPSSTRRKMAFCDAIFEGSARLAGVAAQYVDSVPEIVAHLGHHDLIPITTLDLSVLLAAIKPEVLVDARMRKHSQPETQIDLASLTIGLGPNFIAGLTVHAAVETGYEELGQVIWDGATKPLQGEPREIGGHARDRYVYAPIAGVFRTTYGIGDMVTAGQQVASIGEITLNAPIDGILRGITHDNVPVAQKTKVIEVDPRGNQINVSGIAERPKRIALGVLEAIKQRVTWRS